LLIVGVVVLLLVLGFILYRLGQPTSQPARGPAEGASPEAATGTGAPGGLFMYCAAGLRAPVEQIAADYEREYGVDVQLQYGGSNTLLSQAEVSKIGDLYLAADTSYTERAVEKGLVKETIPLAVMRLVIAVPKGNPKNVRGVEDLLRDDVRTALGNPDQAAIGNTTRELLIKSGHWEQLEQHVTDSGVFKPTVPEVANDIKLGSADAGIIWDTMLTLYPELEAVHSAELDAGSTEIAIGVMAGSKTPTASLRFARYLTARDKGLTTFAAMGFEVVDGDVWAEVPEVTFFCGSVNRRAVDSVIKAFEEREGVVVNTVYNGCGILTAQMRTIRDQEQGGGFPDTYMACDRYYLENVKDWFQEDVDVSDTEVVIAVQKGNPSNIQSLQDLTKPGMRISVGQPDQCTIGALTRQMLEQEGVLDAVMKNVVTQTATSAMLVPTVTTNSVDATFAYATDTRAESDKVDSIRIGSPAAEAVQPFAIARSSDCKYLGRRLYQAIANSRAQFEAAGFHFRLDDPAALPTDSAEK
jgi:molybdenum ABC transporter molybdate-binding protein